MQLLFTMTAPHQWVLADRKGIADSGVVDRLDGLPLTVGKPKLVAVVPGEQVVTRTVDIPATSIRKQLAVIPYAVEEELADSVDAMHFALLQAAGDGPASFAYVARSAMDDWLGKLALAGIRPDAMLPDYLLLPRGDTTATQLIQDNSGRILMRCGTHHGAVVEPEILALWLQQQDADRQYEVGSEKLAQLLSDLAVNQVQLKVEGDKLADWLEHGIPQLTTSLLQGEYLPLQQRSPLRPYRVAAVLAIVGLFALAGIDAAEYTWLKSQQDRIEMATSELYQELFPGSRLIAGKARVQTQSRIDELQARHGSNEFRVLLTPTADILKSAGAKVDELQYRDNTLSVVVSLRNFSHLDILKKRLEGEASLVTRLVQSGARGDKVQARFEISGGVS